MDERWVCSSSAIDNKCNGPNPSIPNAHEHLEVMKVIYARSLRGVQSSL